MSAANITDVCGFFISFDYSYFQNLPTFEILFILFQTSFTTPQ